MTDCEIEQSLVRSSKLLLEGRTNRRLLEAILSHFGNLSEAFVIDWIPEQGEDIYTVVVPPDTVAIVEVSRDDSAPEMPVIQRVPFDQFRRDTKSTTKEIRRKLSVLEKLLRQQFPATRV
jgi:hypothetical protein